MTTRRRTLRYLGQLLGLALAAVVLSFIAVREFSTRSSSTPVLPNQEPRTNRTKLQGSQEGAARAGGESVKTTEAAKDGVVAQTVLGSPGSEDELHPRPRDEWQGMRVNLRMQALCEGPASCGLAMACDGTRCGPCSIDGDCAPGEECALDHCLLAEQVECRTRKDCATGELCILSGYSPGPRGNADMKAYCSSGEGGWEQTEADIDLSPGDPAGEPQFDQAAMLEVARSELRRARASETQEKQ